MAALPASLHISPLYTLCACACRPREQRALSPFFAVSGTTCGLCAAHQVRNKAPRASQLAPSADGGVAARLVSLRMRPLRALRIRACAGVANSASSCCFSRSPAPSVACVRRIRSGMKLPRLPSPCPVQAAAWQHSPHRRSCTLSTRPRSLDPVRVRSSRRATWRVRTASPRALVRSNSLLHITENRNAPYKCLRRRGPDALTLMAGGCDAGCDGARRGRLAGSGRSVARRRASGRRRREHLSGANLFFAA